MLRNGLLSALVGGIALVAGAMSATAAPLPKDAAGAQSASGMVQEVGYRHHHHHHHHHRHWRPYRPAYLYFNPHHRHHHHHYRAYQRRHHHHHHHPRRHW